MVRWSLLGAAIASEVSATLALKAALDNVSWYVVVVAGYLFAFTLLAVVLRLGLPLGVTYGIWASLGVASTAILSFLVFNETLTPTMIGGLGLIIAGVLCVEIGSSRTARPGNQDAA